ncbi:hypothetical protein PFICI_02116 [Pestalotiopsis fici W106-1]|uniref:Uncharacterized protein n=1 Tax=Pestalotiopsis fici (strain W106-1 / CGMCC3.15140) TaxID=1229662 RepID=W3XFV2_PESFW|nr:uncharacterized protein PFICI_02116 [Pestalotiopsis fici W106-1]ETS84091.1 hypothetical protein PFICI_02116 [Pestalotiopsis fici W106-1]
MDAEISSMSEEELEELRKIIFFMTLRADSENEVHESNQDGASEHVQPDNDVSMQDENGIQDMTRDEVAMRESSDNRDAIKEFLEPKTRLQPDKASETDASHIVVENPSDNLKKTREQVFDNLMLYHSNHARYAAFKSYCRDLSDEEAFDLLLEWKDRDMSQEKRGAMFYLLLDFIDPPQFGNNDDEEG